MYEKTQKMQAVQLDILKQIIKLCEAHDITYFAAWGTLLGAVRHKGFIPWDDDIDLNMPRPDFERFCEIAIKELKKPYFLQNYKTDPVCNSHGAMVQNLNTTLMLKNQPKGLISGICVDIMPLDGCNPDKASYKKMRALYRLYKYCAIDWFDHEKYFGKGIKRTIGKIANSLFFGNKTYKYFFDLQEQLYKSIPYETAEYVADFPCDMYGFKKAWFDEKILLDFEDIKICCPTGYDGVLKACYGDYMTPPPENKRGDHHVILVADIEKPYTEYQDLIKQ